MTPEISHDLALSDLEQGAWRDMLRVQAQLLKAVDCELERLHALPLTHYDVLVHVAGAESRRMRMCDLADQVVLSRSGLTRLVDRMVKDGLLERCACEKDARGSFACLTAAGAERLDAAHPTYRRAVRTLFLRHFDAEQLTQFATLWGCVPAPESSCVAVPEGPSATVISAGI